LLAGTIYANSKTLSCVMTLYEKICSKMRHNYIGYYLELI